MTLLNAFDDFMLSRRLMGLSPASLKDYESFIGLFLRFVGSETEISSLSYEKVVSYLNGVLSRPVARATQSTYIRYAKIFLVWIRRKYGLSFEPSEIPVPKMAKRMVNLLNDSQIKALFETQFSSIPWINARDYSMIALMLDSGPRQGEVCRLRKKDIDYERMLFKVTGKGAKDRLVSLGEQSLKFLREYLVLCPYKDSEFVYLTRTGEPITVNTVKVFMNRIKHQTGFDFSSHKLRHNFATNYCVDSLLETGRSNVDDLSVLLGHESVETTKIYEHFAHELIAVNNRRSHLDKIYLGG